MQVAIYGRKLKTTSKVEVQSFFDLIKSKNIDFIIYEPFLKHLKKDLQINVEAKTFTKRDQIDHSIHFVFSLGGDGTILDTVSWIGEKEIPIAGFNFGRLGFLASISIAEMEASIDAILFNQFDIDSRNMIALQSDKKLFGRAAFALNEFTVQRTEISSMITVHTYLDEIHLNSYWADGLIIATATGSTGYSLSCGGPIIYPNSNNFVITPVAPHNLNVRPMVVDDNVVISLKVEGRSKKFLSTLDSRSTTFEADNELILRKAPFQAKLVRLSPANFINAIRGKLLWGEDLRN